MAPAKRSPGYVQTHLVSLCQFPERICPASCVERHVWEALHWLRLLLAALL
jgi:hypothetical protein